MRSYIHGFNQDRAIELGLSNDELLLLRWFVDFQNTPHMQTMVTADGVFYWVSYDKVLEDLPILQVSKDRLKKKYFNHMIEAQVLQHAHVKNGGSFSYYALGQNYLSLIEQPNTPRSKMTDPRSKTTDPQSNLTYPSVKNDRPPRSKMTDPLVKNDRTNIDKLNIDKLNNRELKIDNTKEYKENGAVAPVNVTDAVPKSSKFVKPSLEEVKMYCIERGNNIDPEHWYDYYESNGWKVGKNPMKDWKATVRNWERQNNQHTQTHTQKTTQQFTNNENVFLQLAKEMDGGF